MGLLPLDAMTQLACPKCHASIHKDHDSFRCSNAVCEGHSVPFRFVRDWPVLVDFSSSILREDELRHSEANSPIPRTEVRGLKKAVDAFLFPPQEVGHTNIARLVELAKERAARPIVVIIGGGTVGVGIEQVYADKHVDIISFDVYGSPTVQVIADAHSIPVKNGTADAVVVQAVLEHVLEPWTVADEIHRILKPDGLVYSEVPFMQQVHEGPYDFTRFTESGHRYLFKRFDRIDSGVVAGSGTQVMWTADYLVRGLLRSPRLGFYTRMATFWMRYLDRLVPESFNTDNASGSFFLGRRRATPLAAADMTGHYRGAQQRRS